MICETCHGVRGPLPCPTCYGFVQWYCCDDAGAGIAEGGRSQEAPLQVQPKSNVRTPRRKPRPRHVPLRRVA
jgi:hypothetical protein